VWIESDAADPAWIGGPVRGTVAMSNFGQNGRLGNRLLQYAFLRLYGWRNGLDVAMPHWPEGEALALPPPAAAIRKGRWPVVTFGPFEDAAALELWRTADPPADVDFDGYFQEIPESWLAHRAAFRRLLRLRSDAETRIADWRAAAAPPGTTLVAIHVRRGDFADYDPSANPHFRMAPIAWYRDWLAQAWPTLRRPRLFVATDDRAAVLPAFADFARVDGPSTGLGGVFDDLAGMREADILALCNSSFSRSAALMAADGQRQMIVDFDAGRLVGYDAWADRGFWRRFGPVREFPAGEIDRRFAHALGEHRLRPWRRLARKVPVLGPAMLALRMRFRTGAV
jgi:transposase